MTVYAITLVLLLGSLLAGFLGSLSGLGGGMVIIPLLVLGLDVDIHYAIGTSLIAVIATSTATSCAYVKEGYSNVRIGIFLETATTVGALCGVAIGSMLPKTSLTLILAAFLFYTAYNSFTQSPIDIEGLPLDKMATKLKLNGDYPLNGGYQKYSAHNVPWGYFLMFIAGNIYGVLGLGAGVLKVVAMDQVMKLPFKVSTTTSNFMIGVTAAASAGLYIGMGYIDPVLTVPVVIGVTFGSFIGARLLPGANTQVLRRLFALLIVAIAIQMFIKVIS